MQRVLYAVLVALLLMAGCARVHEPWIRDKDQLAQERSRTDEAQQTLRHRLLWVQTDR